MEQTGIKNPKLRIIFATILSVILVAYIVSMLMPLLTYTRLEPKEVAGTEETVSFMQYLWKPYNYADLTGDVLPDLYKAEVGEKYTITGSIGIPLFAFLASFISLAVVIVLRKQPWNVFFPFIFGLVSLIGYVASPFLNISIINSTTWLIHMILFALALIVSVVAFFMISLPQIRYDRANREKI